MKQNTRAGSRLFFIEFLIVLFFFLIVSTICLKVFVQAHRITGHAETLSQAQTLASSIAELLEAEPELLSASDESELNEAISDRLNQIWPKETFSSLSFDVVLGREDEDTDNPLNDPLTNMTDNTITIIVSNTTGEVLFSLPVFLHTPLTRSEVLS